MLPPKTNKEWRQKEKKVINLNRFDCKLVYKRLVIKSIGVNIN